MTKRIKWKINNTHPQITRERIEELFAFANELPQIPPMELIVTLDIALKRKPILECTKADMVEKYAIYLSIKKMVEELDEETRTANEDYLRVIISNQKSWDRYLAIPRE